MMMMMMLGVYMLDPGSHVRPPPSGHCVFTMYWLSLIMSPPSCLSFVSPLSPPPPPAGFPMHAKSTVNVGSGDPPRWSSKVNMAPAVH